MILLKITFLIIRPLEKYFFSIHTSVRSLDYQTELDLLLYGTPNYEFNIKIFKAVYTFTVC
jgi:hypothetical protein